MYGTEPSQSEIEMQYQEAGIQIGDINLPDDVEMEKCEGSFHYGPVARSTNDYDQPVVMCTKCRGSFPIRYIYPYVPAINKTPAHYPVLER